MGSVQRQGERCLEYAAAGIGKWRSLRLAIYAQALKVDKNAVLDAWPAAADGGKISVGNTITP